MAESDDYTEERPATVADAFIQTAKAIRQFGIERVRIEGLSVPCPDPDSDGKAIRTITEHEFMREFVFHSRPCVIVGALDDWPAMRRWRDDRYLFDLDGHLPLEPEPEFSNEEENENENENEEEEEEEESSTSTSRNETHHGRCSTPTHTQPKREKAEEQEEVKSSRAIGPKKVTVALTPNGRADAVTYVTYSAPNNANPSESITTTSKLFMCAAEVRTTLPELYALLRANPKHARPRPTFVDLRTPTPPVAYAQMQNNCLATEYTHLHRDIRTQLDAFGTRVFGGPHEAANMWLGTDASVSSLHQDWVENLYAVVRGGKEFLLIPPWEGVFVPKPELPSAAYTIQKAEDGRTFGFGNAPMMDGSTVPWMDVEFTAAAVGDETLLPRGVQGKVHPLVAHVGPGEVLYLPAMWLHRVAQFADQTDLREAEKCENGANGEPPLPLIAAVNYWYDMSFTNPAVVMLREFGLLL